MTIYVLYEKDDLDRIELVGATTEIAIACEWEKMSTGEYYGLELNGSLINIDACWPRPKGDNPKIVEVDHMLKQVREQQ